MSTMVGFQNPDATIMSILTGSTTNLDLHCWSDIENFESIKTELYTLASRRVEILSDGGPSDSSIVKRELLELWVEETKDFFDRLGELCALFGLEVSVQSHAELFQGWKILHAAGLLIPQIKYSVNVAFNRHFGDLEMPEQPKLCIGLPLFPKSLRVALGRLRSTEKRYKRRSLYLVNSLFQGWKKGLLPLDIPAFDQTMQKHKKALCETSGDVPEHVLDDVYRISSDLLSRFRFRASEKGSKMPSTSATIEFSKADGGSFRSLLNIWYRGTVDNCCRLDMALDRERRTFLGYYRDKDAVSPVYGYGPTMSELKEIEAGSYLASLFDPFEVLPYGVLEPLKIRTITRPTYRTHWGLRGLQSQLLSYLNRFSTFAITGDSNKDHLESHIQDVITSEGEFLVSGDFSQATDTLKSAVTRVIWEVIGEKGLPWWIYEKGLRSLCGTVIHYDDRCMPRIEKNSPYRNFSRTGNLDSAEQTNGQLMGNILSFPILCIANYVAYHMSIERTQSFYSEFRNGEQDAGKHLSVKHVMSAYPVRINGDDILFRSDSIAYQEWVMAVKSIGFNLSLGKNFTHPFFCQINSQLFRVRFDVFGNPSGSDRIHYFNFGQLTGRKKGMSSDDARLDLTSSRFAFDSEEIYERTLLERAQELTSVRKNFMEMREFIPLGLEKVCLEMQSKWFRRRFKSLLTREQFGTTGLPSSLGGLDFPDVSPSHARFNSLDACSELFSKTGLEVGSQVYPEMFACSKLTPVVDIRRNQPKYPLYTPYQAREEVCRVGDSIRERKFSLVL